MVKPRSWPNLFLPSNPCYSYTDKLPEWIEKFRSEGLKDEEISEILKGKEEKYVTKWGNNSKVGLLINHYAS